MTDPAHRLAADDSTHILAHEVIDDHAPAVCLFCGTVLTHVNDGGNGWLGGSIVDGRVVLWMMCHSPCTGAEALWRCNCGRDNVGAQCHGCRLQRSECEERESTHSQENPMDGLQDRLKDVLELNDQCSLDDKEDRERVLASLLKAIQSPDTEHEVVEAALDWLNDTQSGPHRDRLIRAARACDKARSERVAHIQGERDDTWVVSGIARVPFLAYVVADSAEDASRIVWHSSWKTLQELGFVYTDDASIQVHSVEAQGDKGPSAPESAQQPAPVLGVVCIDDAVFVVGGGDARHIPDLERKLLGFLREHGCIVDFPEDS